MTYQEQIKRIKELSAESRKLASDAEKSLLRLILSIQRNRNTDHIDFTDTTGYPEYYSHYSQDTSPILAVRVENEKNCAGPNNLRLLVQVDDGNGEDFFDPYGDGEIADNLVEFISNYLEINPKTI